MLLKGQFVLFLCVQSAILNNLPAILPDLKTVMSEKEIA